jgi:hypothetical protein
MITVIYILKSFGGPWFVENPLLDISNTTNCTLLYLNGWKFYNGCLDPRGDTQQTQIIGVCARGSGEGEKCPDR